MDNFKCWCLHMCLVVHPHMCVYVCMGHPCTYVWVCVFVSVCVCLWLHVQGECSREGEEGVWTGSQTGGEDPRPGPLRHRH